MSKDKHKEQSEEELIDNLKRRRELGVEINNLQAQLNKLNDFIADAILHDAGLDGRYIEFLKVDWSKLENKLLIKEKGG